ncbi:MAG: hypothetical protein B7Z15_07910 [Rhizobiales bacterium 32-66-8]|nr:MAG: hypothetical protein B7Z15_07910 [Rhizobiales bacterium 32-66-8]
MSVTANGDPKSQAATGGILLPVAEVRVHLEAGGWPEAEAQRPAILAHFARRQAENPALFNGQILLLRDYSLSGGVLSGVCREVDFAAFLWWRDHGFPAGFGMVNVFALPALEGADGAFVLGEMAAHTVNAGCLYFPCGTPDLSDVTPGGAVDLIGSALREMAEETGLAAHDIAEDAGWVVVEDGPYLALMRRLVFAESGAALADRIGRFLAGESRPELSGTHVIACAADFTPAVMPYVAAYIRWRWAQG